MAKYNVAWYYSEWMEYQGFRTQNVCAFHTEEDYVLSEDEIKENAIDWIGETMRYDGMLWDVEFFTGEDTVFVNPDFNVSVWIYPEDL